MASTQSLGIAVLRARSIVSHRFTNLLSRIQPNAAIHLKFLRHKSTVSSRLSANFAISKIQAIGSSSRQSAISQTSDLDLLVVLRKTEATWGGTLMSSDSVLRAVRKQLEERYFNTELGKDGQAITIAFGDGQYPVDIVPAVFNNMVQVGNTSFPRLHAGHEMTILSFHLKRNLWIEDQYDEVFFGDEFSAELDAAMIVRRDGLPAISAEHWLIST